MGGQDKAFADLNGTPLIGHVVRRIAPQVDRLAINAHGQSARFNAFDVEVIEDPFTDRPGPLAGVLAAIGWARLNGDAKVLTVPTDCPFLPADLFQRLDAMDGLAVARSVSGLHPVCALWPVGHEAAIREALIGGTRRMREVTTALGAWEVIFEETPDPFFNVNTPADLQAAAERT